MLKMENGESDAQAQMRKAIFAIMQDTSLTEQEKAQKRQQLMMGAMWKKPAATEEEQKDEKAEKDAKGVLWGSNGRLTCA